MKNLKNIRFLVFAIAIGLFSCTTNQKVDNAKSKFCNSLSSFVEALDNLDEAAAVGTMDDFDAAYTKADKAWNHLENSAAKLEDVEVTAAGKSYDKLVDQINKITDDPITEESAEQISNHIDATASEIDEIISLVCK